MSFSVVLLDRSRKAECIFLVGEEGGLRNGIFEYIVSDYVKIAFTE